MLGPLKGHWADKLRREWQMHRTFQSSLTLFRPDVVFILGIALNSQTTQSIQFKRKLTAQVIYSMRDSGSIRNNLMNTWNGIVDCFIQTQNGHKYLVH